MSIFWIVIAVFYLVLAIVTYMIGRPVLKVLGSAAELGVGSTTTWKVKEGEWETVELESLLHRAFKAIVITDVAGFIVAAMAAAIPPILISG